MAAPLDADAYVAGVLEGDRTLLARAITLIESRSNRHRSTAREVLGRLLPHAGAADRIGITGVPGVGKSTFIESFGLQLTEQGHRVAVLAVDPTSSRTGGSILGDKTRMARLAVDPNAFIRPSPSSGTLGGVTRSTRETMVLVEAAGFDVVLVETVGVGQSETVVADMVDFFLVLMLAGAGDELQGIKKGVLELADMVAVNKAEGSNAQPARLAARDYENALHLMTPASPLWRPPVVTCSGLTGDGLQHMWEQILLHRRLLDAAGARDRRRQDQQLRWMWSMIEDRLLDGFRRDPRVTDHLAGTEHAVIEGILSASAGAERLFDLYLGLGEPDR